MSTVTRTAGISGQFSYTTPQVPFSAPVLTIYSNAARTTVAVAAASLAATANPVVWTASYPSTLAAGTYYLSFSTVYTSGQPAFVDQDDELLLIAADGSVATSYATVTNLRTAPYSITVEEASDVFAQDALDIASRIVDSYTGREFATQSQSTKTFYNVNGRVLVLPHPVSAITSVTHNGSTLGTTTYDLDDSGVLLLDTPVNSSTLRVTATYGDLVIPSAVKRATLLIAAAIIRNQVSSDPSEEDVQSRSAEGYSVSYDTTNTNGITTTSQSTGVPEADLLLKQYREPLAG